DPGGIVGALGETFGAQAALAARLWRDKQLEFTFRRALMRRYVDFDRCTAQALSHMSGELGVELTEERTRALLEAYLRLPAYPDAEPALKRLKSAGCRIVALTNGTEKSVRVGRDPRWIFDPWEFVPDVVIGNLEELHRAMLPQQ